MTLRLCLDCGQMARDAPRCPACTRARERGRGTTTQRGLGQAHRAASADVMAAATVCAVCGCPPTHADPLTRGHIVARAHGGTATAGNYQAEHRSCGSAKGSRSGG